MPINPGFFGLFIPILGLLIGAFMTQERLDFTERLLAAGGNQR